MPTSVSHYQRFLSHTEVAEARKFPDFCSVRGLKVLRLKLGLLLGLLLGLGLGLELGLLQAKI